MANQDLLAVIGANLRAERARRNFSQEDLAHAAGMAVTQVARMERGEVDSGITKYVRIAQALGVEVATLLEGIGSVK